MYICTDRGSPGSTVIQICEKSGKVFEARKERPVIERIKASESSSFCLSHDTFTLDILYDIQYSTTTR